jgi:hypothetical protein
MQSLSIHLRLRVMDGHTMGGHAGPHVVDGHAVEPPAMTLAVCSPALYHNHVHTHVHQHAGKHATPARVRAGHAMLQDARIRVQHAISLPALPHAQHAKRVKRAFLPVKHALPVNTHAWALNVYHYRDR